MKSYLSLIPISAKVHKRQNRMTLFCIIIAVFLVTAVFSMADMGARMEKISAINEHGNWHIMLKNVTQEQAQQIAKRDDVVATSWYNIMNYRMDEGEYYIANKRAVICGGSKAFATDMVNCITQGHFPEKSNEIIISDNIKDIMGLEIGDNVTLTLPSEAKDNVTSGISTETKDYVISGFCNESVADVNDAILVIMDITSFNQTFEGSELTNVYYVQFNEHMNIRNVISEIKQQYGFSDTDLSENSLLLGVVGYSSNTFMIGMYMVAGVLFVLILLAGVLMIAGSINSNVAERSQFFGMMRCIGATRKQIIHFVRMEALNWCKTAIPIGVFSGIAVTWMLCAALRFGVGGEFADMPVFGVSTIGIVSGVLVGFLTVHLAAKSPAKHAARVSPMAAVNGYTSQTKKVCHAANTRLFKIETALGIYRAGSAKKNLLLMTGSFALSIILFLSFSIMLDFIGLALKPMQPYAPDLCIATQDQSCGLSRELITQLDEYKSVKRAFGRMYQGNVPVSTIKDVNIIDLISYETYQFDWANAHLAEGSHEVLTVYDKSNPLTAGDKLVVTNHKGEQIELVISEVLSTSPFDNPEGIPTVICTEETFTQLTGKQEYAVIDIQLNNEITEADVTSIRNLAGANNLFSDRRESNRETVGTYWAFTILVYGFLAIIAMITVFNIINSISMSVSAKIKQYGAMRAIGMGEKQLLKMITAEALTYAISGCFTGCILGIPINQFLYKKMITNYWGNSWELPGEAIIVIFLLVFIASAAAVQIPSKRISAMTITDTINEL